MPIKRVIVITPGLVEIEDGWSEKFRQNCNIPKNNWVEANWYSAVKSHVDELKHDPIKQDTKRTFVDDFLHEKVFNAIWFGQTNSRNAIMGKISETFERVISEHGHDCEICLVGRSLGSVINTYFYCRREFEYYVGSMNNMIPITKMITYASPLRSYLISDNQLRDLVQISNIQWINFVDPKDPLASSFADLINTSYAQHHLIYDIKVDNGKWFTSIIPGKLGDTLSKYKRHMGYENNKDLQSRLRKFYL